jgi:hypothetical protein
VNAKDQRRFLREKDGQKVLLARRQWENVGHLMHMQQLLMFVMMLPIAHIFDKFILFF